MGRNRQILAKYPAKMNSDSEESRTFKSIGPRGTCQQWPTAKEIIAYLKIHVDQVGK